jgi:Protein of unknown function (DUF664)
MPGAQRRATCAASGTTVDALAARAGPAHGRGGARLVPGALRRRARSCTDEHPDGDFDFAEPDGAEAGFAAFRQECELARAAAAGHSLDETFVHSRTGTTFDLRWVYTHMIEEYARHNGHADILREQIDGVTGD